jgi:hypothetical protein
LLTLSLLAQRLPATTLVAYALSRFFRIDPLYVLVAQVAVFTLATTGSAWLGYDEAQTEPVTAVSAFGPMPCGYCTLLDVVMMNTSADSGGSGVVVSSIG